MKGFKVKAPGGKIKVRGLFKTSLFAFTLGIAINFGRIYRYIIDNGVIRDIFSAKYLLNDKNLLKNHFSNFSTQIFEFIREQ